MNLGSEAVYKQSMMPSSSGSSWKPAGAGDGGVSDQFPAGLRVLVVDDDPTCLMIMEKMLRNCEYEVTKCNRAEIALSILRENKTGFDIVLSDVHMPDMDGFKLLEHIGLEMILPVIMMSADDSKNVVMKGVTHGACDYLIKPVRMEALRNIWQHVVRKRKHEWKDLDPSASVDDSHRKQKLFEDPDYSSSTTEGNNHKNSKRKKHDDGEVEDRDDSSSLKKPRVVWSVELHQQFVAAVSQLRIDKAVPKKILELMNVPGLTRENVASHLQKYRLYLRRMSGSHHSGGINTSFTGNPDPGYGSMSSLNGLDLQALAASDQSQSLTALSRSNNSKPMNLLHGIPTNMEPKQFASLHQSGQHSFGSTNDQVFVPMGGQSQSQSQTPSSRNHHPASRQHVLPNEMLTHGGFVDNTRDMATLTMKSFPLGGSAHASKSTLQGDGNSESKVSRRRFVPSHDNLTSQDVGLTFDASHNPLYPEHYIQDDLLTAILKQDGFLNT